MSDPTQPPSWGLLWESPSTPLDVLLVGELDDPLANWAELELELDEETDEN